MQLAPCGRCWIGRSKINEKRPFGKDLILREVALQVPSAKEAALDRYGRNGSGGSGYTEGLANPNKRRFGTQSQQKGHSVLDTPFHQKPSPFEKNDPTHTGTKYEDLAGRGVEHACPSKRRAQSFVMHTWDSTWIFGPSV